MKAWDSRSVGTPLQHRIFHVLLRLGGRPAAHVLLAFVASWYALCRPDVRRRARPYLGRRFPGAGPLRRLAADWRILFELGRTLVDRAALGILGPGALDVDLAGQETLRELLAEGRGLVLLTAHVGCWQAAMASLSVLGTPVALLIHRDEADVDRHVFEYAGGPSAFRVVDPAGPLGGTLEMLQILKEKQLLCIMGDRVLGGGRSAVAVDFLGSSVQLPSSPYQIASAAGAPVAVVFPHRSDSGRYVLGVAAVLRVPPGLGRRPEAYRPYAAAFSAALEGFVDAHPYQFFNFFDMWKGTTEPSQP